MAKKKIQTKKGLFMPDAAEKNARVVNLSGEWIGDYRGWFGRLEQVVKIIQNGEDVVAIKITGDEHVPGGKITFHANITTGLGEGLVAEKEYRNPKFVPGKLKIISPERISFSWLGESENIQHGNVEFRKDD